MRNKVAALYLVSILLCCSVVSGDVTVTVGPDMAFHPASVTIAPGETVTWDFVAPFHTTTSDATTGPEVWNSGVVAVGNTFSHTFNTAGAHEYYCAVHSSAAANFMNGVVNVVVPAPTITSFDPTSGPSAGGNSVTITGTGFTDCTSVTFGGVAASFVVQNTAMITATAPAHDPGGVVIAVTCGGQTGSSEATYTYVAAAAPPTITTVAPSPAAVGTTITVTGTGFAVGVSVTIGGVTAATVRVDAQTLQVAIPDLTPGEYPLVVMNPDEQSAQATVVVTAAAAIPTLSSRLLLTLVALIALGAVLKLR